MLGLEVFTAKHAFSTLAASFLFQWDSLRSGSIQRKLTFASHSTGDRFTVDPGVTCGSIDLE